MKITNNYNLPESIYNVLNKDFEKPTINKIRVTDLINPPYMYYLKIQHWDEIEEDASDRLWALLGTAVHYILEKRAPENSIIENRLEKTIHNFTITGQAVYNNEGIEDWKITSVWSFVYGNKIAWERQLNCYAWLYRHNGYKVKKLTINAILRDWKKSRVNGDYPPIPFVSRNIQLWSETEQDEYIKGRLLLFDHIKSSIEFDRGPILTECLCTNEDKWQRIDRKGVTITPRCQEYCSVREYCAEKSGK